MKKYVIHFSQGLKLEETILADEFDLKDNNYIFYVGEEVVLMCNSEFVMYIELIQA
jgi:hypothetical protein